MVLKNCCIVSCGAVLRAYNYVPLIIILGSSIDWLFGFIEFELETAKVLTFCLIIVIGTLAHML